MTDFSTSYSTTPPTPITPEPESFSTSSAHIPPMPTPDPITTAPPQPVYIPKHKSPIGPILLGFFLVIFLAGVAGVMYFQSKLSQVTPTPNPTSSPSPSVEPSAVASASPKATKTPVSAIVPLPSPKAPAIAQPSFDIRFGNPSTNIKQTIDEGNGDGRVINREYTSIQTGQFDEAPANWSSRVTTCYHIVANELIPGKDIKFIFTLDDKVEVEGDLGQYDKLEAGRLYDWCHDVVTSIGKHTARLQINSGKSPKESNYVNNFARLDWENLADKIAPNYTLIGPNNEGTSGTCLFPQYISDNVTPYTELKIEQKADAGAWTTFDGNRYCFTGTTGSSHTYTTKITDARGNSNEQNKVFNLF